MRGQRGFGRGRGAHVEGQHVALQGALLAVAIEALVSVLSTYAGGSAARFGRDGVAAQAIAAHRGPYHHPASAGGYGRRFEPGHAAGARAVHAAGGAFQHFEPADEAGVEQVERGAATGLGEG